MTVSAAVIAFGLGWSVVSYTSYYKVYSSDTVGPGRRDDDQRQSYDFAATATFKARDWLGNVGVMTVTYKVSSPIGQDMN